MDRLKLIAKIAKKIGREKVLKAKSRKAKVAILVRRHAEDKNIDNMLKGVDDSDNICYWTDASKYADTYYGETYRETTKFDNAWD